MSSLPSKLKEDLMLAENYWKIEIKVFLYCAVSHENYSLSHRLPFEYVEFSYDVHFVSFWLEIRFWANFVQKIKTVGLSWNFASDLFEYAELCRKYVVLAFSLLDQKNSFWVNLVKKIRIFSLSWNLIPRLIWYVEFNDDVHFICFWP